VPGGSPSIGHGHQLVGADVGATRLLGHELRALQQLGGIERDHALAVLLAQLGRAVAQHQHGGELGDGERAHQAELGLREEVVQGELHQRRHAGRPAEDRPMRRGMQAELVEADLLHLAIGGVMLDPLHVAAEAVAVVQHRRMLVGKAGPTVEIAAGELAQAVEVRPEVRLFLRRQVEPEQIAETRIGPEQVQPAAVAADMVGAARRAAGVAFRPRRRDLALCAHCRCLLLYGHSWAWTAAATNDLIADSFEF
jgi:hypothetical protein